jgi:hypothetical protein
LKLNISFYIDLLSLCDNKECIYTARGPLRWLFYAKAGIITFGPEGVQTLELPPRVMACTPGQYSVLLGGIEYVDEMCREVKQVSLLNDFVHSTSSGNCESIPTSLFLPFAFFSPE